MAQVNPISQEEQLQPVAQPVSTYTRPASPAPSSLNGLAQSLSQFSGDLGGYLRQKQAKLDDADKIRGEAAGLEANGAGYAEGVRNGSIPSYNSPIFQQGFKLSQGQVIGKTIAARAVDAYQSWPLRNSQDPQDFDNFLGGFIKQNIQTNDPDILKGALPYIQSSADALYNANEKDRSSQLYDSSVKAHIASSSMDVDNAQDLALSQQRTPDYDALWSQMMSDRSAALASGIRADDYDKSMQEMVQSKALEFMDPAMLGMLKNKVPGQTYSYADQDGGKSVEDTLDTMQSRQAATDRLKLAQQTAADEATKKANTAFVVNALAKNPNAVFDPQFISQASALDPTLQVNIKSWSADLSKASPEDPEEIMRIQQQVLNGGGVGVIEQNLGPAGAIHDPATLSSLFTLANSVGSDEMKGVLDNQTVKKGLDYIQNALGTGQDDPYGIKGITPAAIQAQTDFLNSMYAWKQANPNARYDEIGTQAAKTLKEIQAGIPSAAPAPGDTAQPGYTRPDAITKELEAAPANNAEGEPNAKATGGTPDAPLTPRADVAGSQADKPKPDPDLDPWRGEQPPTIDNLSQAQKDRVNSIAANQGVDPQVVIDQIYNAGRGKFVAAPQGSATSGQFVTPSMANPQGMTEAGNIDLSTRKSFVDNGDGTYSTVATIGIQDGGKEVVIPTVIPDGQGGWKKVDDATAEDYYRSTGQNFGKFNTPEEADAYAEALHNDQAAQHANDYVTPPTSDGADNVPVREGDGPDMNAQDASVGKLKPVVDLIGQTEGTDAGRGYDETIGYGKFDPQAAKPVSQMTLGEVKQFQRGIIHNGGPSDAVGRYQIIGPTLKGLETEMGLKDSTVFTPQLQDQMMMHLLNRRGLQSWLSGSMSNASFINGLSKEWASLPNSQGSGSYPGQRVGTTTAHLTRVLDAIKASSVPELKA